jgi:fibronectin type 3 domain-containing protein
MVKMLRCMAVFLFLALTAACGNNGPAAPKNLTAVAGSSSVALSWDSVDSASETTKYNVYRGTTNSGSLSGKSKIASSLTEVSYTDSSVAVNTTYYYQVTAENSKGESVGSSEVAVTVGTLPAPTNLTGISGVGQVDLSWDSVLGATGYNIYRGTTQSGSLSGKSKIGTGISTTNYTDATVSFGTTYYYQVTATDGSLESGGSNEVAVTP